MKSLLIASDPDFGRTKTSPSIDFIKLFSKSFDKPLIDPKRCKSGRHECAAGYGMQVTIQNPTVGDLEAAIAAMVVPVIIGLEVSIDFRPKGKLTPMERVQRMEDIRLWLLAHLYPWGGTGLQFAHRVSSGKGHSEPVWCDRILRRPGRNETLYLGHANDRYADPEQANYAFMRLYEKKTDMRSKLPPGKSSVRVEVSLNEAGCRHFGLNAADSLFGFRFRQLSDYFKLVRPFYTLPRMGRHWRGSERFAEMIANKMLAIVEDQARIAGVWSLHNARHVYPTLGRHVNGNRIIGTRLDNLTKKYLRRLPSTPTPDRPATSASDTRIGSW